MAQKDADVIIIIRRGSLDFARDDLEFARFVNVARDLRGERIQTLELFFRPEIAQEPHFDFFAGRRPCFFPKR